MNAKLFILLLIGIWIGLVLGLSFIEAPLKFKAPGITSRLGVGIGQLVFGASNKIQLFVLFLIIISLFYGQISLPIQAKLWFSILLVVIALQSFYLLPVLDMRASQIIKGNDIQTSHHHISFICLEILKLISLILLFTNIKL